MSQRLDIARKAIGELRELKYGKPFAVTPDIDVVWGLSAPGTVKEIAEDGAYSGTSFDRMVVEGQIKLMYAITASRLGMQASQVIKIDIEQAGPLMFYNGEDEETKGAKYAQNQALREWSRQPDFPIPEANLRIESIPEMGTPAQVKGMASFLHRNPDLVKVAVVSLAPHSVRVGRYLEYYKGLFPAETRFINAAVPTTHHPLETTFREITKVQDYYQQGHLSEKSIFGS